MTLQIVLLLLGAYLLGSIPTAFLFVRLATGQDIRRLGDGNVGAKNTYESVSRWMGFAVAAIDIAKGWLAIRIPGVLGYGEVVILLAGAAAIIGHDFSIFLHFQGGQGMAATVGVFLALFPTLTLAATLIFLVMLSASRNWDLSCMVGFVLLVLSVWATDHPVQQQVFTVLILPWIGISKLVQNWQDRRLTA